LKPRIEDPWFEEVRAFWGRLAKCTEEQHRWDLMVRSPTVYGAYLIYQRGETEDQHHPLRYVLEARMLAGQTSAAIARLVGLEEPVVDYYGRIFFDVADRLRNRDYIMTCVLGPAVTAGMSDRDFDLLWKLYGYLYGPVVLDNFIYTTSESMRPDTPDAVAAALAGDARQTLTRKAAIVSRTFSINQFSQSEILNLYARLLEIETARGQEKAQDLIMSNISAMMDKLTFTMGDTPDDALHAPRMITYDKGAAELNTDELMRVTTGQDAGVSDEVVNLKYPEPLNVEEAIQ
jgi:hypothetical protein